MLIIMEKFIIFKCLIIINSNVKWESEGERIKYNKHLIPISHENDFYENIIKFYHRLLSLNLFLTLHLDWLVGAIIIIIRNDDNGKFMSDGNIYVNVILLLNG